MTIHVLSDVLANKIAAGEVVERPASVVKELVENSIDAQSTAIKIELKEAGLEQIRIIDNGIGMSPEDCEKAFLRHATSKINTDRDLFHIRTLGFRGEALASIAAVSRLSLKSSKGKEAGSYLYLESGEILKRDKSDARKGTEIVVDELFFNTPARLKYMKTLHTELGHITDYLNRIAFAHPHIRMEVFHNDKLIFRTTGSGDLLQVISQIYGLKVAENMLPVQAESLDYQLSGYISKPELTRASRTYITTIVNGRYIRSPLLFKAIQRAYHTLLPIHRFPIIVLHLEMDPILVDVNVHPTKLEVRFSKDRELMELIEKTIYDQLSQQILIPSAKRVNRPQVQVEQQHLAFNRNKSSRPTPYPGETINKIKEEKIQSFSKEEPSRQRDEVIQVETEEKEAMGEAAADGNERIPMMYPIGQLHGTYILAQNEDGLYMIDQHAAQERIKYEYYKEKLATPSNERQTLLIPLTFDFTRSEAIFVERHIDRFHQVGLDLEPFGENTYILRSYPTWFPKGLEEEIVRDLVQQIIESGMIDIQNIREETAITLSCKRSIKANEFLNLTDMTYLIESLNQTNNPFTCPHGRPIFIHLSTKDIEKMFKRIM